MSATTIFKGQNTHRARQVHHRICRMLDSLPPEWGFRGSMNGYGILAALKPYIVEMLNTEQLTEQQIVEIVQDMGFAVTDNYMDFLLSRSSWKGEMENKIKKERRVYKKIAQSEIDSEIVEVCRQLPIDEIDSRILVRYWEITRKLNYNGGANFLAVCDTLNALERKAREEHGDLNFALKDWKPEIRSEDEIKAHIRFD